MRNYLSAECYKAFRRKYFYIALAVCLGLELVLLGCYWLTMSWGNPTVSFGSTAVLVPMVLSVGLYAALITGDIVFSDQYKYNTLKNEVAYGIPRRRIYLGKLAVTALTSVLAALVMLGLYLGGCWLLFPHAAGDGQTWALVGYCLAGALPLWLAGLAVVNACYFLIRSNTIAAFAGVGILALVSQIFQLLGLLIHPVFEVVRQFMPNVMLDTLANMAFQWNYVGLCWVSGLVWCAGATAVGLLAFRGKEIK